MRAHNSEHRDFLPVLDVTALRHVAYVLDAILFYMRASNDCDIDRTTTGSNVWDDQDENENEDAEEDISTSIVMDTDSVDGDDLMRPSLGRRHSFFQRSDSTLCLGCPAPDPFNAPLAEALPLADQPHLLQPNARREELFGMPKRPITLPPNTQQQQPGGSGEGNVNLEVPPVRLSLSASIRNDELASGSSTSISNSTTSNVESVAMEIYQEDETSQDKTTVTTAAGTATSGVEISIPVSIYQDATKQQLHKTTTIVLNEKGEAISPIKEVNTVAAEQPKAGPSGEQSSSQSSKPPPPPPPAVGGSTTGDGGIGYYRKKHLFYIKAANSKYTAEESDDVDVDEISIISSDEPQDLSQSSIKIDVDTDQDHDELSESDSEDSRQIIKRQKLDDSAEPEPPTPSPTVVVVQQDATTAASSSTSSSSSSAIRPPIIVTRRKTVSIEGGTTAAHPPPPPPAPQAATAAAAAGGSGRSRCPLFPHTGTPLKHLLTLLLSLSLPSVGRLVYSCVVNGLDWWWWWWRAAAADYVLCHVRGHQQCIRRRRRRQWNVARQECDCARRTVNGELGFGLFSLVVGFEHVLIRRLSRRIVDTRSHCAARRVTCKDTL